MKHISVNIKSGLIIPFILLTIIGIACSQSKQVKTLDQSIQELTPLTVSPENHYLEIGQLSPEVRAEFSDMDQVRFPDQANKLVLMTFEPAYLTMEEINELVASLIHPANSSEQTRAELDFLLDLQNSRTKEQVSEALRMHDIVYFPIVGMKKQSHLFFEAFEVYGDDFNADAFPKTRKLFHNVMKDMRELEFNAKNEILRARPRQLESKLQPLKKMKSSSFASGHTLWAYLHAYLFSELDPSKRNEFIQLAYEIGFTREVLGVHYPSDEEASRKLAHDLLSKMWSKKEFIEDFRLAKLEWE